MTKAEFKAARQRLGLSSPQLAHVLACDARTVRRYEDEGDPRPVAATAARVMAWLLAGFRPPEWPAKPRGYPPR